MPAQSEPHPVDLPRAPLNSSPSAHPVAGPAGEVAEVLCLVRDGGLTQTVRRVGAVPTRQQQLDDLSAGPTAAERRSGLTSALTGLSLIVRAPLGEDDVTVEVTEADEGTARTDEMLGYAQIVCTLTARSDVGSVVFTQDGEPLRVPRADGSLTSGPVRGWDYRTLIRS
ncbi:GerMN domain-containing protein [Actinoplanes sp. NPDC051861]|uniref:GerMN domain-containing protein n=1 Tax=Actinoplanes sp. NPDC051861 TaxID=3155170 RepID=UPI00341ECDA5